MWNNVYTTTELRYLFADYPNPKGTGQFTKGEK